MAIALKVYCLVMCSIMRLKVYQCFLADIYFVNIFSLFFADVFCHYFLTLKKNDMHFVGRQELSINLVFKLSIVP
jgi:hypothetical protein